MTIDGYFNLHEVVDESGKAVYVEPRARVESSPSEGYDYEAIRKFEKNELQELVAKNTVKLQSSQFAIR